MQANQKLVRSFILTATLACASVMGSTSALAASACKGLDTKGCSSNSSCRWVEGYERKDGRQVKAFCRTSPVSKKTANTKLSDTKSSDTKSGDKPSK